jgi:rfaE bifunctional protein nucleotidyltransferase chain/domain
MSFTSDSSQVLLFLQKFQFPMDHSKLIQSKIFKGVSALMPVLNDWRESGNRIVFTNGCFDLIHRGHVDSLTKAAGLGDRLIVGLNADVSVRQLKGSDRPLNDEQSRATILAAFQMVDAVILFEEETPYELIRSIVPDILVKGAEYQLEEIAGHDVVLAAGGRVERIGLTAGYSTSDLIKKIKDRL